MFSYLWLDQGSKLSVWNLPHYFYCLKLIFQRSWLDGLKFLVSSSTSKVIFLSSVTSADAFLEVADHLRDAIEELSSINPSLATVYEQELFRRPYLLYCFFLEYQKGHPDAQCLKKCTQALKQEDLHLLHKDLRQVFSECECGGGPVRATAKRDFWAKFQDRDAEIEAGIARLVEEVLENEGAVDSEEHLELVQDLDLFLFKEITVKNRAIEQGKPRSTNVLLEMLHRGFSTVTDYIFTEGYSNVRAVLKKKNSLELENEVAQFNVSFFITLLARGDIEFLKKVYHQVADLMQLANFLEILREAVKLPPSKVRLLDQLSGYFFGDPRFRSLFC